jgi:hypothetical protein
MVGEGCSPVMAGASTGLPAPLARKSVGLVDDVSMTLVFTEAIGLFSG